MKKDQVVNCYIDGAARGNPGKAGWGAVLFFPDGKVIELGGANTHATNNQMELTAAIEALSFMNNQNISSSIVLRTDSTYVLRGITAWVFGWQKNGWRTSTDEPVANENLWRKLVELSGKNISWEKVKGHDGAFGNEMADTIATDFADNGKRDLFSGEKNDYENKFKDFVSLKKPIPKKSSSKKAYSYVSSVDGIVNVDSSWDECKRRVEGKKGARYKKVFSKTEESDLVALWKK